MRIALKAVANNPSTPDTTASKASGGGAFLDILFQGTQDAVQGAKAAGSQTQSDANSSGLLSRDDAQSHAPSSQAPSGTSAQTTTPQVQTTPQTAPPTTPKTNPAGTAQTGQPTTATAQNNAAQSLTNLLTLVNLTTAGNNTPSQVAQVDSSSPNPTAPSGKQAGAPKSAQSKQDATTPANTATLLPQAIAVAVPVPVADTLVQTAVVAPQPATAIQPGAPATSTSQVVGAGATLTAVITSTQALSANQTGSQLATTASLAADAAAQGTAQSPTNQATNGQPVAAQGQQDASAASTPAAATQFKHDLSALTATAAKASLPNLSADASSTPQAPNQNPAQTSGQPVASTFLSAALQQNTAIANQTTAKVIPFKIAATNLGTNSNVSTAAPSSTAGSSNASTTAPASSTAKSNSQDSSNGSSRDSQGSNDAGVSTQAPNSVVRPTDANPLQTPALATFADARAAAQPVSTGTSTDATPSHVSDSHTVPAEPANASLSANASAINTARVIQNMNETEMRVGMHSTEFGDISIRTTVTQQQMQAQISVDHSELVSALTAHIPSVQAKLGADYGLHASIEVSQGGASFSNNQGQSSQRDYKPFTPSAQTDGTAPLAETDRAIARPVAAAAVVEGSRLDIRA